MISANEYKYISDRLGYSYAMREGMLGSIYSMLETLDDIDMNTSFDANRDLLLGATTSVYSIVFNKYFNNSSQMSKAVDALQSHIIKHYGSVNSFLRDKNIKVIIEFANLSKIIGYEIDESNIE